MDDNLIYFNDKENPFFSLRNFLIKINFKMEKISENDPNSIDHLCEFIHEYVHYLQSFTTINGLSALLKYIDTIIRITVDIQGEILFNTYKIKRIIKNYEPDIRKMNLRLFWSRGSRTISVDKNPRFYFEKKIFNPIFETSTNEIFMYNIFDEKYHHISSIFLREHMAMMAYFYAHGIGQDAVLDYVKVNNLNCKYWIIFSYFLLKHPEIKNVVLFTFFICELALMDLNTGSFFSKLLSKANYLLATIVYNDEDTFFNTLFNEFLGDINRNINVLSDLLITVETATKKLSQNHTFYFSIHDIIKLCKKGLEYKKNNPTIFRNILDGKWIDRFAKLFLSPLIIQPKGIFSVLFTDNNYMDRLGVFFGVTIIIEYLIRDETILACPFHDNIPICKLYDKYNISEICLSDPFSVTPFDGGGCLFYNSCLILGLLPPSEFTRIIENENKQKEKHT